MSHFAKVEDGIVTNVIVAEQSFVDKQDGTWVQTSYNTYGNVHYGEDGNSDDGVALRGNYAGIGYIYDSTNDVFHAPKPHASWTLGSNSWIWNAPITYPDDDKRYHWDEDLYQSDNSKGWVEVS
jgi:hypothetical protein